MLWFTTHCTYKLNGVAVNITFKCNFVKKIFGTKYYHAILEQVISDLFFYENRLDIQLYKKHKRGHNRL